MSKLDEFLVQIEQLDGKATPGEWWNESGVVHAKAPNWTPECHRCCHPAYCESEEDAEFVALSRTALPLLVKMVREMTTAPEGKWTQPERWRFDTNEVVAERVLEEAGK